MREVTVTELRRHLPVCLARVRCGEKLAITSRGNVMAVLAPPTPSSEMATAARARLRGSVRRYECPFEPVLNWSDLDMHP